MEPMELHVDGDGREEDSRYPQPAVLQLPSDDAEPIGKRGACSIVYNGKLYMFGGYSGSTSIDFLPGLAERIQTREIIIFDFTECKWSTVRTRGEFPRVITGACATVIGECLYLFGGWYRGYRNADINQLNLETLTWKKLTYDWMKGGPMCKDKAGMVDYGEEMLCVMAGYGYQQDGFVRQEGASYHWDSEFLMELCWTNELHLFHVKTCEYVLCDIASWCTLQCFASWLAQLSFYLAVVAK